MTIILKQVSKHVIFSAMLEVVNSFIFALQNRRRKYLLAFM
jgi:hypothetical protein